MPKVNFRFGHTYICQAFRKRSRYSWKLSGRVRREVPPRPPRTASRSAALGTRLSGWYLSHCYCSLRRVSCSKICVEISEIYYYYYYYYKRGFEVSQWRPKNNFGRILLKHNKYGVQGGHILIKSKFPVLPMISSFPLFSVSKYNIYSTTLPKMCWVKFPV